MTEREQVRERIANIIRDDVVFVDDILLLNENEIADAILSDPSIAILADDQSLPENPYTGCQDYYGDCVQTQEHKTKAYLRSQQDMLNAGFRKVVKP